MSCAAPFRPGAGSNPASGSISYPGRPERITHPLFLSLSARCRGGFYCRTMRDFAKAFYKSRAWQECRAGYAASVGGLCEDCLDRGLYRPGEIVHHMIELTPDNINDPAVSLSWSNLRLLCRDCHAKRHGARRRYRVDPAGRVTSRW